VTAPHGALASFVERLTGELRFPALFGLTAALFLLDLLVPDLLPFADEILLGLATLLLGSWKRRRRPPGGAGSPPGGRAIDGEPGRGRAAGPGVSRRTTDCGRQSGL
jgi:hypothetical protein